jgi:DNA repair protein RecO (recombination protein O)
VRALGEKDRVLTLLTADHGKVSAAARGARGAKSKLAAVSQPFTLARFLLVHGRSMEIVTQAEIENAHTHIALDLLKSAWASYLCELCDAVPESLPEETLFHLLSIALAALDETASEPFSTDAVGRWFEARYLSLLGYAPTLGRCVACGIKISAGEDGDATQVSYSPLMGGNLCDGCGPHDPQRLNVRVQSLRALRRLERAPSPVPAGDLALTTAGARDLRNCLRRSLQLHLELKLKSQIFLDDVTAAALEA